MKRPIIIGMATVLLIIVLTAATTTTADRLIINRLTVKQTSAFTGAITAASTFAATGDVSSAARIIVGTFINETKATTVTVTNGGTITPTGTFQPLTSAGNVGTSSLAGCVSGRLLVLVNLGSNTITLTDTSTLKLSGNAALATNDNVTLLCDGVNWNQVGKSDN